MADKDYGYPEVLLSDGELLSIVGRLWFDDLIRCKNKSLIASCLGLDIIKGKGKDIPGAKITVNSRFIDTIVEQGYKLVIKPEDFFAQYGPNVNASMLVIHQTNLHLYCLKEAVDYVRSQCEQYDVDLIELAADDPTYMFVPKS